jgi:hypothetical protein
MMLVFLFLTWYSAYYNKVTDCGCFGDAIKLSSWETFYKNIVLIVLAVLLLANNNYIKPLFSNKFAATSSFLSLIVFSGIVYHVITHLPIIDFRAYAVGNNIKEQMMIVDGEDPKITDFSLMNQNLNEVMSEVLGKEKVLFVVMYDLEKSDKNGFEKIQEISNMAIEKGYSVYLLTSSMLKDFTKVKRKYQLNIEPLFADGTVLKTMIRANPGLMVLSNGTITGKANWRDAEKLGL